MMTGYEWPRPKADQPREWEWQPQPGFTGWLRRSCCKAPDTMSHHYADCVFFDPTEVTQPAARAAYVPPWHVAPGHGETDETCDDEMLDRWCFPWTLAIAPPSSTAASIFSEEGALQQTLEHFLGRNQEYGDGSNELGIKGQYADINRKVIKLKRYLWDGEPVKLGAETPEVIAKELVGHLLILIDGLVFGESDELERDAWKDNK